MSSPDSAEPVELFASILYAESRLFKEVLVKLSGEYGAIGFISEEIPFNYTDYYAKEMGALLKRRFVFFEEPVRPESLPDVKLFSNHVEDEFSINGMRRVNLDPGYIAKAHLILATGKGYTHRPYLRDGIYADLTLIYEKKSFRALPWTYPDYAEKKIIAMFNRVREGYAHRLKYEMNKDCGTRGLK
jgi:hypothetical protein